MHGVLPSTFSILYDIYSYFLSIPVRLLFRSSVVLWAASATASDRDAEPKTMLLKQVIFFLVKNTHSKHTRNTKEQEQKQNRKKKENNKKCQIDESKNNAVFVDFV